MKTKSLLISLGSILFAFIFYFFFYDNIKNVESREINFHSFDSETATKILTVGNLREADKALNKKDELQNEKVLPVKKILKVPYKVQPTKDHCQSTCLKMLAMFYQKKLNMSLPGANRSIESIYNEINSGNSRPINSKNNWRNFKWWLNNNISDHSFSIKISNDEKETVDFLVKRINNGHPVLMSTNHSKSTGHIILVIGYINYLPDHNNKDFKFICHDPYGKFAPELNSQQYGNRRYETGMSLNDGSEDGVGKGVGLGINGIKRNRSDQHSPGQFVMVSTN